MCLRRLGVFLPAFNRECPFAEPVSEAAAEAAEEEEAERVQAAVAVVAEMQLTAEQLRART